MFHQGERLISPPQMLLCSSVSVGQRRTTDSQHALIQEMSYMFQLQTHTGTLTCVVEDMLERERPSRSDSRLEETVDDFGVFAGTGETKRHKDNRN